MARKSVKNFSVNVTNNAVIVEIHTENIKPYKYQILPDEVQGNIQGIAAHLQAGLAEAQRTLQKIEVSEFFERNYVTIVTPVKRIANRYTAKKL
jgi:hypothetical protein|tara:strand:+ start:638 stop:919 length:282 start_codon:yes stop_codon:yes gene_type:complete